MNVFSEIGNGAGLIATYPWAGPVFAAISGLVAALVLFIVLYGIVKSRAYRKNKPTLDADIEQLSRVSMILSELSAKVVAESEAQVKAAQVAAEEARTNEQLASLSAEQAHAVNELFSKSQKLSTRVTIWIGVASLVVSNAVSIFVTVWFSRGS